MAIIGQLDLADVAKVFATHYQKVLQELIEKELMERAKEFIRPAAEKLAERFVAHMRLQQDPLSFRTEVHVTVNEKD